MSLRLCKRYRREVQQSSRQCPESSKFAARVSRYTCPRGDVVRTFARGVRCDEAGVNRQAADSDDVGSAPAHDAGRRFLPLPPHVRER